MLNFSWKDFTDNIKEKLENASSEKDNKSLNIAGDYSYFLEISAKGEVPYQTCVLSVNAFTKKDKNIAIATKCKWQRVNGDRIYTLSNILSNTY